MRFDGIKKLGTLMLANTEIRADRDALVEVVQQRDAEAAAFKAEVARLREAASEPRLDLGERKANGSVAHEVPGESVVTQRDVDAWFEQTILVLAKEKEQLATVVAEKKPDWQQNYDAFAAQKSVSQRLAVQKWLRSQFWRVAPP